MLTHVVLKSSWPSFNGGEVKDDGKELKDEGGVIIAC